MKFVVFCFILLLSSTFAEQHEDFDVNQDVDDSIGRLSRILRKYTEIADESRRLNQDEFRRELDLLRTGDENTEEEDFVDEENLETRSASDENGFEVREFADPLSEQSQDSKEGGLSDEVIPTEETPEYEEDEDEEMLLEEVTPGEEIVTDTRPNSPDNKHPMLDVAVIKAELYQHPLPRKSPKDLVKALGSKLSCVLVTLEDGRRIVMIPAKYSQPITGKMAKKWKKIQWKTVKSATIGDYMMLLQESSSELIHNKEVCKKLMSLK